MFKLTTIRAKLSIILILLSVALLGTSATLYYIQNTLGDAVRVSGTTGSSVSTLINTARRAHVDFQRQVQEWKNILIRGNDADLFEKHRKAFLGRADEVQKLLQQSRVQMTELGVVTQEIDALVAAHTAMLAKYNDALSTFNAKDPESGKAVDVLVRGVDRETSAGLDKLNDGLVAFGEQRLGGLEASSAELSKRARIASIIAVLLSVIVVLLGVQIIRTILRSIGALTTTVQRVADGDYDARAKMDSKDEIGELANTFDRLLDDRLSVLQSASKENEQLNHSVIEIMQSVAQLSQRDLTVKVPVTADVTGAISDAINLMTGETTKVLKQVSVISGNVAGASARVVQRSNEVLLMAQSSGTEANAASGELAQAARALKQIADQAQNASKSAESAIAATGEAMNIVRATVEGISLSRDQIRETEKRVKRLGERSQEISSVVGIIGQIAERTSVLALNASMQAVAAGDAGRGFAVVADEVKRLAENARQATQQIASLVTAIQSDTVETTQAMNSTIQQVVEISKLAERAGGQMQQTRSTTEDLVSSVRGIVTTTDAQARSSDVLLSRARQLVDSSQKTLSQLGEQRKETDDLQSFSRDLLSAINVFRLPA